MTEHINLKAIQWQEGWETYDTKKTRMIYSIKIWGKTGTRQDE